VYKRSTERPRRPWVVWFFDASKQAFAGVLQHVVNLGFGVIFAKSGGASECAWYITNFTISVACGVVILVGVMRAYNWAVERYRLTLLRSGEYGSPPSWKPWLAQMLIWGFFSSAEKVLTAVVVILPLHRRLDRFAAWLERPFAAFPALELILVMVIAPVLLNMFFFWVMDNLIMRHRSVLTERSEDRSEDDRPHDDKQPLLTDDEASGCIPPFTPTRTTQASEYVRTDAVTAQRRAAGVTPGGVAEAL